MIARRGLLAGMGACAAGRVMAYPTIPQRASARVIIDNDFAGDPDGLVALTHQLLTPKTRTTLITTSALDPKLAGDVPPGQSAAKGKAIALELLNRGRFAPVPVEAGAESFGDGEAQITRAAHAIVAEAMRDDRLPLYITCGGPLTNIAAALRIEPRIASRATLVWIGGGAYPAGGWEYNLNTDMAAAKAVIERSAIPLWQIPQNVYRLMQFSNAELHQRMRAISPFGRWLYERFTHPPAFIDVGGSWPLGDSPTVLLSAISQESSLSVNRPARRILADGTYGEEIAGRMLRVFETLDARLTFEDFLALMAMKG